MTCPEHPDNPAPQAFHRNCISTQLQLPTPVPFGPKGRTLHLFQLNFILLNSVHHSILSKMPEALLRFFQNICSTPTTFRLASYTRLNAFFRQLCSLHPGFKDAQDSCCGFQRAHRHITGVSNVVMHTCNSSIWEVGEGYQSFKARLGFIGSLRPA